MRGVRRCVLAVLFFLVTLPAQQPQTPAERALPRRPFPYKQGIVADADGYTRMAIAVGDDYFDGKDTESRVLRHLRIARAAGAQYLRCAFSWNGIEPERGKFQWRFWDRLVDLAQQNGITLIPYVAYTPRWAAASDKEFWKQAPRDPDLYAEFMFQLAKRYRGRVQSWELWNEPDLKEYWQGTTAQFAEMIRRAAVRVREADPDVELVLGGMSLGPSPFYRELIDQYHLDRYADVIAVHAYPESWHEARIEMAFEDVIAPLAKLVVPTGDDYWLDEMGYPDYRYTRSKASVYGVHVYYAHEHTRAFQAVALFRMFTLARATQRLALAGWYRIDDFSHRDPRMGNDYVNHHLGLIDVAGQRKPDFFALRLFAKLFDEPAKPIQPLIRSSPQSQAVVNVFERRDGKLIIIGWLRSPEQGEVPATGNVVDRRRETVDVGVPCTEMRNPVTYSSTGVRKPNIANFARAEVHGIPLTGAENFIAVFDCLRD